MFLTPELMKKRPEKHVHSYMKDKSLSVKVLLFFPWI